jgi:integrase
MAAKKTKRVALPRGLFQRMRKGGLVYGITFQWQKQQQQELVGPVMADAVKLRKQRLDEVAAGTYSPEHKTGEVKAAQWANTWGERRKNKTARDDRTRLRLHFVPYLGDMKLTDIRPRHIIRWIGRLIEESGLEAKAIHNVYGTVRTMFKYAVIEELITATPCVIPENTLPPKPDKVAGIYEKPAVVKLLTAPDDKVPLDRRVYYWLAFFTGMRHGELAGRRWRDIDWDALPLAALDVRTQYNDQPLKSPDGKLRPRKVPIHPLLRAALEHWRDVGFPKYFGRSPKPDDFIVPSRRLTTKGRGLAHRTVRRSLTNLVERDCPALGIEPLNFHRTRDTFISLARRAGAPKDVVERITHNSKGEMIDTYTHLDWAPLCAAVLVIDLPLNQPGLLPDPTNSRAISSSMSASMSRLGDGKKEAPVSSETEAYSQRGGRDSNPRPPA